MEKLERFKPTSGRITGVLTIVVAGLAVLMAVTQLNRAQGVPFALAAVFVAVLAWAAMLRPEVAVSSTTLVLRNMLETVHIPLVAIESLAVRQFLAVRAGDRRYISPAVGKSWRKVARSGGQARTSMTPEEALTHSYADFVEARIRHLCDEARTREGVARGSAEQFARAADVRRQPAWAEICSLGVLGVGFLVAVVL